jgi:purine-binding chemotaxis protein CheW
LSLDDLVEVCEGLAGQLRIPESQHGFASVGSIEHRNNNVPLFDLGTFLGLGRFDPATANYFLVLIGSDHPWALPIDRAVGIFPAADFTCVPASDWFFQLPGRPFRTLAIWRDEPLVLCEALSFERALVER